MSTHDDFLGISVRLIQHSQRPFLPILGMMFESSGDPCGNVLQNGKVVHEEVSGDGGDEHGHDGFFGDGDVRVVTLQAWETVCDADNSFASHSRRRKGRRRLGQGRKSFSGDVRSEVADEVGRVFYELAEEVVACLEFVGAELKGSLRVERLMHHFTVLTPSRFREFERDAEEN